MPLGQPERHITLYKISHFSILRLLAAFRAEAPNFVQLMLQNEVSVGLLKKKHIALLSLNEENNFMFNISQDEKHNKFRMRKKQLEEADFMNNLIYPCQVLDQSAKIFYALSTRYGLLKPKGFILRLQPLNQRPRLIWLNEKSMLEVFQPIALKFPRQ